MTYEFHHPSAKPAANPPCQLDERHQLDSVTPGPQPHHRPDADLAALRGGLEISR